MCNIKINAAGTDCIASLWQKDIHISLFHALVRAAGGGGGDHFLSVNEGREGDWKHLRRSVDGDRIWSYCSIAISVNVAWLDDRRVEFAEE